MPTATLQSPRLPEGLGGDEVLPPPEEQGNNGWPFCRDLLVERSPAILAPWGGKAFTWPGGAKQAQGRQAVGGGTSGTGGSTPSPRVLQRKGG